MKRNSLCFAYLLICSALEMLVPSFCHALCCLFALATRHMVARLPAGTTGQAHTHTPNDIMIPIQNSTYETQKRSIHKGAVECMCANLHLHAWIAIPHPLEAFLCGKCYVGLKRWHFLFVHITYNSGDFIYIRRSTQQVCHWHCDKDCDFDAFS